MRRKILYIQTDRGAPCRAAAAGKAGSRDKRLCARYRLADVFAEAGKLSVRTMIIDVEPLVASWRSGQEALDRGIARVLGEVRLVPSVRAVVIATNSARRPSAVPACEGLQVRYRHPPAATADRAVP